jgi:hypothetical protein
MSGILEKGQKVRIKNDIWECFMPGREDKTQYVNNLLVRCSRKTGEPLKLNEKNIMGLGLKDVIRIKEGKAQEYEIL